METKNTYSYPIDISLITSTVLDSTSHSGPYKGSVDFAVPVGAQVFAALDGEVTRIRDDSDRYSDQPSSGQDVNYITIRHKNGELSEYLHLAKDSVTVNIGDLVKVGQPIAKTGLSGWMYAPHLHFMVYQAVNKPEDFQCLEVRFDKSLVIKNSNSE